MQLGGQLGLNELGQFVLALANTNGPVVIKGRLTITASQRSGITITPAIKGTVTT